MKFIAILKDSLREAIDAKVFYVTVGLSALLILLAFTTKFTPAAGGKMVMEMAAVPLSVDLNDLDPNEMQGGGPGGDPERMLKRMRGLYKVKEVYPLDNAPDAVTSTFRVVVTSAAAIPFFGPKPDKVVEQIKERFGHWGDKPIAEVVSVKHENGEYLIDARVTEVGQRMWPHGFSLFFGALPVFSQGVPLGAQLYLIETILVISVGAWVTILISIVMTAFFIPNMIRKGTVDMLIVKPVRRTTLLLYKYVGGLLFIFLNTVIVVAGVWLALSVRSGVWAPSFLLAIPVITFFFAILYSVSTLFGVLSGSPIVSILVTCGAWFLLWVVGLVHTIFGVVEKQAEVQVRRNASEIAGTLVGAGAEPGVTAWSGVAMVLAETNRPEARWRKEPNRFADVVAWVHYVLPRTGDLDTLMTAQLQRELLVMPRGLSAQAMTTGKMSWGESLTVSGVFIAVMLGLACWWFSTRDY